MAGCFLQSVKAAIDPNPIANFASVPQTSIGLSPRVGQHFPVSHALG